MSTQLVGDAKNLVTLTLQVEDDGTVLFRHGHGNAKLTAQILNRFAESLNIQTGAMVAK